VKHKLAVTGSVGLLLASLTVSCTGAPSTRSDRDRTSPVPVRSLSLTVLPPVAQPGAAAATPDVAQRVLVAAATPARRGARVTLQRRATAGWRDVATASTNAGGQAQFAQSVSTSGPEVYRAVSAADPQVRSQPGGGAGWKLRFSDEFDGTAMGPDWDYRALGLLSATSGRKVSASSKEAVQVRDGTLRLQVRADPAKQGHYLNGHVSTESSYLFRYGVAAARVKFQRPRGMHGAFWIQSPAFSQLPGNPGRAGAEIDVAEYFGDGYPRGGLASYVYHVDKSRSSIKDGDVQPGAVRAVGSADAFWKRFHVFSVEWSPDGYVFRVDSKRIFETHEAVSKRRQYLVLSMLSSDWELPKLDRKTLPATMQVDWVRVWQRSP
jgi:beta-glucanase (GH16 family)